MDIAPLIKTVAATAAMVAGLGLAVGPAHAETQTHQDPRGDVAKAPTLRLAEARTPGIDVVSVKNSYQGEKLTMAMTAANLLRKGYTADWYLATVGSSYFVRFDHRAKEPTLSFYDTTPGPGTKGVSRGAASCLDARGTVRGDTIIVAVPRFCVADASGLRIAGVLHEQGPTTPATKIDDSRRKGFKPKLRFGPVLHRN